MTLMRVAPTFWAISVSEIPSTASSTIRARWASPARTEVECTSQVSFSRSPSRKSSRVAGWFAIAHGPPIKRSSSSRTGH